MSRFRCIPRRCERCNADCPEPAWRYLLNVQAQDHTGCQWLTAFGDAGDTIMGCSAVDIKDVVDGDSARFEQLISENNFRTFLFKLKVAEDTYGDEQRIRVRGGSGGTSFTGEAKCMFYEGCISCI